MELGVNPEKDAFFYGYALWRLPDDLAARGEGRRPTYPGLLLQEVSRPANPIRTPTNPFRVGLSSLRCLPADSHEFVGIRYSQRELGAQTETRANRSA